eukprot:2346737-Pyramimonas_sp.AAC.1
MWMLLMFTVGGFFGGFRPSQVGSVKVLNFNVHPEPDSDGTVIELTLETRPCLMRDITYMLLTCNVNIVHINMYCVDGRSTYTMVLSDLSTEGPLSAKTIQDFHELLKRSALIYTTEVPTETLQPTLGEGKE